MVVEGTCFEAQMLEEEAGGVRGREGGGGEDGGGQRQLRMSAARKRSSESSLWVRERPGYAWGWGGGGQFSLPVFSQIFTLSRSKNGGVLPPPCNKILSWIWT